MAGSGRGLSDTNLAPKLGRSLIKLPSNGKLWVWASCFFSVVCNLLLFMAIPPTLESRPGLMIANQEAAKYGSGPGTARGKMRSLSWLAKWQSTDWNQSNLFFIFPLALVIFSRKPLWAPPYHLPSLASLQWEAFVVLRETDLQPTLCPGWIFSFLYFFDQGPDCFYAIFYIHIYLYIDI